MLDHLKAGCTVVLFNAGSNEPESKTTTFSPKPRKPCFLLNPEKNLAQICLVVFEKNTKTAHFNSEK